MAFSQQLKSQGLRTEGLRNRAPTHGRYGSVDTLWHQWRCFLAEQEGTAQDVLASIQDNEFYLPSALSTCASQVKSLKTLLLTKYSYGSNYAITGVSTSKNRRLST